jgi:hypothetical protein
MNTNLALTIQTEQEKYGRWIAEAIEISGAPVNGFTHQEAVVKVEALVFRILADRLDLCEIL